MRRALFFRPAKPPAQTSDKGETMTNPSLPHDHGENVNTDFLGSQFPSTEKFQAIATTFKQLGDPTRVRIFWFLCHYEECVANIGAVMEMSSPAVSHHLRLLKDAGLITGVRRGKEVFYKAADNEEAQLLHKMIENVMKIKCPE